MQTITINRLTYSVTAIEDTRDAKGVHYELRGVRGASYFTMRNIHNGLMTVWNAKSNTYNRGPFDGEWLTDENGKLETRNA